MNFESGDILEFVIVPSSCSPLRFCVGMYPDGYHVVIASEETPNQKQSAPIDLYVLYSTVFREEL